MEAPTLFDSLPGRARIWMYAADRTLDETEQRRLIEHLEAFCAGWKSHGRRVESAAAVLEGRFAVLAGDIPNGDISGCGIDASVHALDNAARELDVNWMPALAVHYREDDGQIASVSRPEFRALARAGAVTGQTLVFDLSLETLDQLRNGRFEQPALSTWHGRVFRLGEPTVSS